MTGGMRVAIVALDFHREGGSENRTGHLIDALCRAGHEVHLIGARIRGPWDSAVRQHTIPACSKPRWVNLWQFANRATALVKQERFDIVHNQIRPFAPGLVTIGGGCHRYYLENVLPKEKGRLLACAKRWAPFHRVVLRLERHAYRPDGCPFVIANSQLGREGLLTAYPMPAERVGVAYNGVDAARFSPDIRARFRRAQRDALALASDDLVMLFVGSGFARKGLGGLISALGQLKAVRPMLLVVGSGRTVVWKRRAERAGLAGRIRFVGHVREPERFYAAADVFALPTLFDPFANATLEAMASGLPVVTSRQNGAAEIMRDGVNGLVLTDAQDVSALAEALSRLADPVVREQLGSAARSTALEFPWERTLELTLAVYDKLAGHGPQLMGSS